MFLILIKGFQSSVLTLKAGEGGSRNGGRRRLSSEKEWAKTWLWKALELPLEKLTYFFGRLEEGRNILTLIWY